MVSASRDRGIVSFQAINEKKGTEIQKEEAVHGTEYISLAFSREKAPEEI